MHNLNLEVMVRKTTLIEHLKNNKKAHVANYQIAKVEYFKDIMEAMNERIAAVEAENLDYNFGFNIQKPMDAAAEYDKYVKFFEMCEDEFIKIKVEEFNCIVEDKWHWAVQANQINTYYSSKNGTR